MNEFRSLEEREEVWYIIQQQKNLTAKKKINFVNVIRGNQSKTKESICDNLNFWFSNTNTRNVEKFHEFEWTIEFLDQKPSYYTNRDKGEPLTLRMKSGLAPINGLQFNRQNMNNIGY